MWVWVQASKKTFRQLREKIWEPEPSQLGRQCQLPDALEIFVEESCFVQIWPAA